MRARRHLDIARMGGARPNARLALGVSAGSLGLAILTAAGAASAADITVDAGSQVSGNPRFWSEMVGTGTASLTLRSDLQTHYKIARRELGMLRVRGHGVLNDDMGIYKGAGSYDWSKYDQYLDAIAAADMRPGMELSFMPTALASSGNSRNPPKDQATYKAFIQAVVQHTVDKFGADDVSQWYWEVWNEPNYSGFWTGSMNDYFAMYDSAVAGATAALPNIMIGGPVTTQGSTTEMGQFLDHAKSSGARVSFLSSHAYPGGAGTSADASFGLTDNNSRVNVITTHGYTTDQMPSLNTEWNTSYSGQGGNTAANCVSMDTHVNAPFIIKAVKLLADQDKGDTPPLAAFSYWVVSDVFDESSGPSGSYILAQGGNLPFGQVFGLMTFQGVRKAAFNGFKMLNLLGDKRLKVSGGTQRDGVDAMATISAAGDELQIIVYNYYSDIGSSGNAESVNLTVSNIPATLAGKEVFVTHFRVDETHSNPYNVWATTQGKTKNPTEAQWQEMRKEQHLALMEPVSKETLDTTYTATLSMPRQSASMVILGLKRPVTGRDALVDMEGEDYDGQSGITKEDCTDTSMGQSITGNGGAYIFYDDVDFRDAGVDSVELRVNAQAATTLELRADSQTGTAIGSCAIPATNGWATQTCELTPIAGVHTVYAVFGGAMHVNSMKFVCSGTDCDSGGTGGTGGTGPTGGAGGGTSTGGTTSTSGGTTTATGGRGPSGGRGTTGGTTGVTGGTTSAGGVGPATGGSTGVATGGSTSSSGGSGNPGVGGQSPAGGTTTTAGGTTTTAGGTTTTAGGTTTTAGGTTTASGAMAAGGQSAVGGAAGGGTSTGASGSGSEDSESSGCGCRIPSGAGSPFGPLAFLGLAGLGLSSLRRRRSR
jgi:xylan 1,4-beta-xylosidase